MGNKPSIFISRGGKFVTFFRNNQTSIRTYMSPTKTSLKRLKRYCKSVRQDFLRLADMV